MARAAGRPGWRCYRAAMSSALDEDVVRALIAGEPVVFPGLGRIATRRYNAFTMHDPATGEPRRVPERIVLTFSPARDGDDDERRLQRPSPLGASARWALWGEHGLFHRWTSRRRE